MRPCQQLKDYASSSTEVVAAAVEAVLAAAEVAVAAEVLVPKCLDSLFKRESSKKQTPLLKALKFASRISQVRSVKNFFAA